MLENWSNTAILIFALSPRAEKRHKKIRKGTALFRQLTKNTLSEVQKTGLPFFHLDEREQIGNSFGERFSNAIQHFFDQGFQNVIALGNDCPQLTEHHILKTASQLHLGKNVIAPSLDGGFNLLGIQKEAFRKEVFYQLPWQKDSLLEATMDYFAQTGQSPMLLKVFSDIDSTQDVALLLKNEPSFSKTLYHLLLEILKDFKSFWHYSFNNTIGIVLPLPFNKGSPFGISVH